VVRVWDCSPNGSGATKGEYAIISGRINDIAWDGDSQRVIAVGDGKQRYGHCVTADSGNTVGEITGHSAQVSAVSIRQQRPLRAATAGDDKNVVFYHGAPFKFNDILGRGNHANYIYGVAFSPDGSHLVSVGGDKKIWIYDGKTGEVKTELSDSLEGHKGSIFGVSWSKDSKSFVTCSADRTVKIWDTEAGKVKHTWAFGETVNVDYQQVGVVWPAGRSDGLIISLSLSGQLNYLNETSSKPTKAVSGHQKNITALTTSTESSTPTLWTGDHRRRGPYEYHLWPCRRIIRKASSSLLSWMG
jgi:WD repeat-containing protein 1 (actin-interacting protein 1)